MRSAKNIKIKTFTWSKDSHGLFDYESNHLNVNRDLCRDHTIIARDNGKVIFINPGYESIPNDCTPLCKIDRNDEGRFMLSSMDSGSPLKLVIRSLKTDGKQKGFEIRPGDRIKTGRVEYYIREIRYEDNITYKAKDRFLCLDDGEAMDIEHDDHEKRHCRICFGDESLDPQTFPEQKFVTPCKCKGTSQHIHSACLRQWLASKKQFKKASSSHTNPINVQNQQISSHSNMTVNVDEPVNYSLAIAQNSSTNNADFDDRSNAQALVTEDLHQVERDKYENNANITNHNFSNFCCDVCHGILPFSIKFNRDLEYETVDISRPETGPYLFLERITQGKDPKNISIIKGIEDQEVKMGRGHISDIIISDISVSRLHSYIKYQNGKFFLFDKNSKFGTLAQLKDPVEIQKDKIGIQCGRTLITLSLQEERIKEEAIVPISFHTKEPIPSTFAKKAVITSKKKAQSHIKLQKDQVKDGGSEGTLDVEEIVPPVGNELQTRSKKINKNNSSKRGSK